MRRPPFANQSMAIRTNSASGTAWMPLAVVKVIGLWIKPLRTRSGPMPALVA